MGEFEPYMEYKAITPEMARKLALAAKANRQAGDQLIEMPTPKRAARVVKAQRHLSDVLDQIEHEILVVPSMVLVAGEKETTMTDDGEEEITQRCTRCQTVLGYWREDLIYMTPHGPQRVPQEDVPWWDEGSVFAKPTPDGYPMSLYEVPAERTLASYEHECVGLPDDAFNAPEES